MENLFWSIMLWLLVFLLIPIQRVKKLWPVAVISFIWLFILEYIFTYLGYYRFVNGFAYIASIPLFHMVGGAAGGILLVNWMQRNPLYKILLISLFSGLLSISEYIMVYFGAFKHLHDFNFLISYVLNIAGLSFLTWFSIAAVGEDTIYKGNKTRYDKKISLSDKR
ncbi:hypothetical protein Dtox_3915 [Desulfofarcimen acetoxidans DSM 771]|uniref:Uncharacterized protein n=1 Tax=Desulfofarcimen acetoxidans (strain ATCC 49208 / DSM 771 / KCTC 5769 / VKM B-1644 / 5575) TaxID=485916 RepID=C8VXX9_DESAS|nr:hypothetical protein [Desulfofarcimen acetoxidans]ACV64608.1 hypothetical protein Dtox_3915 [Desulfofarcimen acetoxidans DSM 771]